MAIIELYIAGSICDLSPDFGIRLNRQLINPAELNTKDAQFSYSIELPATSRNNEILHYTHVEEAVNKFNRDYRAQLYVDGVLILEGNFRLTGIAGRTSYKGNLYIPVRKSVSDIFGQTKLNEIAPYPIPFIGVAESITLYNTAALTEPQPAIFPYVLYGLLPKVPITYGTTSYSGKSVWDNTVRIGIEDFPPSVNPLKLIRHIFNSRGYAIEGSAFNDARLTELYMSYRNEQNFKQPWNYGYLGRMHVKGNWHSWYDHDDEVIKKYEKGIYFANENYAVDLLDATNTRLTVLEDNGGNIINDRVQDSAGATWTRGQIVIPVSGFYKVKFFAQIHLNTDDNFRHTDPATGIQHVGTYSDGADNVLSQSRYEIHLLRDKLKGEFGVENALHASTTYYNNMPQTPGFIRPNVPSYFPQVQIQDGSTFAINLVDLAQNDKFLLGMSVGYAPPTPVQVLAAKPAFSWDNSFNDEEPTLLAINNPGYRKYGVLGSFDSEGENPNGPVDYADGDRVEDSILNMEGAPVSDASAAGWVILNRFPLSGGYTYVIDGGLLYTGYCYVFRGDETVPHQILEFIDGVVQFDTTEYLADDVIPCISLYLVTDSYDVDGSLTITREIEPESSEAIGWEVTNRFKIDLINAPAVHTRLGYYNGVPADGSRDADTHSAAVVWLEAGERLTVASVSEKGGYRRSGMHTTIGMVGHRVEFELEIEPFRSDKSWLKVNSAGRGTAVMDWDDESNFSDDTIDLVQFLPKDIKIDDFIDNFCKAFNLKLSQSGPDAFSLDVKQVKKTTSNQYVNLDSVAAVKDGVNTPIGLPTYYRIGFTVDPEEEGYVRTQDDGGGEIYTGAIEGNVIEQRSTFSYNWFKRISKTPEDVILDLPIISDNEPWVATTNYGELMANRYYNKALRFWYINGLLSDSGAEVAINGVPVEIARVGYEKEGDILNYKNQPYTILDNFFTVLVSVDSHYTELEGYISQTMYHQLDGTRSAMYNGDLYYVAEISGYDPQGVNKTKIKIIRRI